MLNLGSFETLGTTRKSSSNSGFTATLSTPPSRSLPGRRSSIHAKWKPRDPPSPFHQFTVTHAEARSSESINQGEIDTSADGPLLLWSHEFITKLSLVQTRFALLVRVQFKDHPPLDFRDTPSYELE